MAKPAVTLCGGAYIHVQGITLYFYRSSFTFGRVVSAGQGIHRSEIRPIAQNKTNFMKNNSVVSKTEKNGRAKASLSRQAVEGFSSYFPMNTEYTI